jgi:branched-chain amino acid aminotransferase
MTVFLNGQFVPEAEATVSVLDRSFLYGDGLFETMRVANGKVFRWAQHLDRLERGAQFLGIKIPFARAALGDFAAELVQRNQMPESLLRLTLSRGVGVRGYSPKGADRPVGAPSTASARIERAGAVPGAPLTWKAHVSSFRLPAGEVLAQFKTCNKLAQILARAEAEVAGAEEALLCNTDGFIVEAASSNLFWVSSGAVCTPPLTSGILAGVTREVVCEICARLDIPVRESLLRPDELAQMEAAFLSLSSHGVVELSQVDGVLLGSSPVTRQLHQAYHALVAAECVG